MKVPLPMLLMWKVRLPSIGAEEILNGCHSSVEIAGMLRKQYWPTPYSNGGTTMSSVTPADNAFTPMTLAHTDALLARNARSHAHKTSEPSKRYQSEAA